MDFSHLNQIPTNTLQSFHLASCFLIIHLLVHSLGFLRPSVAFSCHYMPPRSFIQPSTMDRFDVYNQVTLRLPPNPYLSSAPLVTRIRATPTIRPKGRGA